MYPGPCWWRYSRSRAAVLVAVLALSGAPTRGAFVAHHHLAHALGAPRLRGGGRGVEKEGVTTLVSSAGMPRAAPAPAAWAGPMARQALSGLQLEYPHKVDHLWLAEDGALAAPAALHPVFYGNYDCTRRCIRIGASADCCGVTPTASTLPRWRQRCRTA